MAKTVHSRKAKGRTFQNKVVSIIQSFFGFTPDEIRAVPASVNGPDIILSEDAHKILPFDLELKCAEQLNIWRALQQATDNTKKGFPAVIFKRNHSRIYITLDLSLFLEIYRLAVYSWLESGDLESWKEYLLKLYDNAVH